jgi:hypothetical protein
MTTTKVSETGAQFNNLQTITTSAGDFAVEQRNAGFAENDGRWIVTHLGDLYWRHGELHRRARSVFLGVFDTTADADAAIRNAQPLPEDDHAVR